MDTNFHLIDKLKNHGFEPQRVNKKTIQEKIIQMFDELELKTTQNMLLKKQNDDIILQIHTIKDLFTDQTKTFSNYNYESEPNSKIENSFLNNNPEKTHNQRYQQNRQDDWNMQCAKQGKNDCVSNESEDSPTTRKNWKNNKNENHISSQLQALIQQNEMMMKRMSMIENHFIQQKSQSEKFDNKNMCNFDDRATMVSSEINLGNQLRSNKVKDRFKNPHQRNLSNLVNHYK